MLKLPPRLHMAADMVRPGSAVADIGTDHAFLSAFLVLQGISPRAVASDVRPGPLRNAKKTVEKYALEEKITLLISDGLDGINGSEVQEVILCGMGGTLISSLLSRAQWLKDPSKRIIIQAQSHAEDARKFFIENGFQILREAACEDDGKLYSAMCAQYTGLVREYPPEFCYTGLLPQCREPQARQIIEKSLARLDKKHAALQKAGREPELAAQLDKVTKAIKKTLAEAKNADG